MDRNEIIAEFDALAAEARRTFQPGVLHDELGYIAAEQMRAGLFPEAMATLDKAVQVMKDWQRGCARLLIDISELTGADPREIARDDFRLSVLSGGFAMAGRVSEARDFASQISTEEGRLHATIRIYQTLLRSMSEIANPQHDKKNSKEEEELGRELASVLRAAAELAERGELESARIKTAEAHTMAQSIDQRNAALPESPLHKRARELADLALRLKIAQGDKLPADFARKQMHGGQATDKNGGPGGIKR